MLNDQLCWILVYMEVKRRFLFSEVEWGHTNQMQNNLVTMFKKWRILCPCQEEGGEGAVVHF